MKIAESPNKMVHYSFISLHFKPSFPVVISILLKGISSDVLAWKMCLHLLTMLCFTCVEEKLEQNSVRKPLLLTMMHFNPISTGLFVSL